MARRRFTLSSPTARSWTADSAYTVGSPEPTAPRQLLTAPLAGAGHAARATLVFSPIGVGARAWIRLRRMDLTVIKAKIAAGVLPQANGVSVRQTRYVPGVCVGCDGMIGADDVGVQFFGAGR